MKKLNSDLYSQIVITALAFALVVIFSSLWNLMSSGFEGAISSIFFPEVLALLIIIQVFDYLLRLKIEKLWLYRVLSLAVVCVLTECAGVLFIWFRPTAKNILVCALLCLVVSSLNYRFWVSKYKSDSDKINKKLAGGTDK